MGNAATTEGETEYAEAQAEIERLEATPNPDEQVQHKLQLSKTKLERAKLKIAVERAQEKVRLVKEKHPGDDERIKDVARELLDAQQALDHEEKVKRKEELNDPENMDDYSRAQRALNTEVAACKEDYARAHALAGSRTAEDIENAVTAKKNFARRMRNAEKLLIEFRNIQKKEYKHETNLAKSGQNRLTKEELSDRTKLVEEFGNQMTKLKEMMATGAKKRSRPKFHHSSLAGGGEVPHHQEHEVEGVDSSDLDQLPDLDPSSWENYQQFIKGDEEVDAMLAQVLAATESNYDKASAIQEESQKQDILSRKLQDKVGEALDTSYAANDMADDVIVEMEDNDYKTMCCYIINFSIIGVCTYYIYSNKIAQN